MHKIEIKNLSNHKAKGKEPDIHEDLFKFPFAAVCVGARHSGKSNLTKNLFLRKELYGKHFRPNDIIIISPTLGLDDSYDEFKTVNKFNEFSEKILEDILESQKKNISMYGKKRTPWVVVILDDLADDKKAYKNGGFLEKFFLRGRHYKINIWVNSQKITSIGRSIRVNATQFIMFEPVNASEIDFFLHENSNKKEKDNLQSELEDLWKDKYTFLAIDHMKPKDKRYSKNFGNYFTPNLSSVNIVS
jgi:hypothetical protein